MSKKELPFSTIKFKEFLVAAEAFQVAIWFHSFARTMESGNNPILQMRLRQVNKTKSVLFSVTRFLGYMRLKSVKTGGNIFYFFKEKVACSWDFSLK